MKFKILIIILCAFFLAGCDAEYQVIISEDNFQEQTSFTPKTNETYDNMPLEDFLKSFTNAYIPSFYNPDNYDSENGEYQYGVEYYTITDRLNGILVGYQFNNTNIYRSRIIKEGFTELSIQKNDDTYSIKTNGGCKAFDTYPLLENLTVKITTEYNVIYSNADEVKDNTYFWYLTRDDAARNIHFIYRTKQDDFSDFNPNDVSSDTDKTTNVKNWFQENKVLTMFIAMILFTVIIFLLLILQKRTQNKN